MTKNIKILLVDDEEDFTQPMAFWFQTKGYNVSATNNGLKALEIIEKDKPDIIFLDLNMPVLDGVETLKKIREVDGDLPVIVISAYADPEKIKIMEPYGISGVFYKGSEFHKGLTLLESILRTHKKLKR